MSLWLNYYGESNIQNAQKANSYQFRKDRLISALKDKESWVRSAAAEALGEIKDPRAVEPLISALKDEWWHVREAAAKVLEKITGQSFGEDPAKWQAWWEENKGEFLR